MITNIEFNIKTVSKLCVFTSTTLTHHRHIVLSAQLATVSYQPQIEEMCNNSYVSQYYNVTPTSTYYKNLDQRGLVASSTLNIVASFFFSVRKSTCACKNFTDTKAFAKSFDS